MSKAPKKKTPPAEPATTPVETPYPGAVPRPRDFPTIAQVAQLAAVLANGNFPERDEDARRLPKSALRIWHLAHDERAKQLADAEKYWHTIDSINAAKIAIAVTVKERLATLGALELFDAQNVSWKDAATLLWKGRTQTKAEAQLKAFVEQHLAGVIDFWKQFSAADFVIIGFDRMAFHTLIQLFVDSEAARENAEVSAKFSALGTKSAAAKKNKSALNSSK